MVDPVAQKFETVARERLVKEKQEEILTNQDLELIWTQLREALPSEQAETVLYFNRNIYSVQLNYVEFCSVAMRLPLKCQRFFKPSIYLRLDKDDDGRIHLHQLFQYILRRGAAFMIVSV